MAQLVVDGVAICRWCKEPLSGSAHPSGTRPREVHPEHLRPRKNALGSRRWTRAMDDAVSLDAARALAAVDSSTPWRAPAARLQSVLNSCVREGASPHPDTVARLMSASAELLESLSRSA